MNCRTLLASCFLLLVSLASTLFADDIGRGKENNFVMYVKEQFEYSSNAIRTRDGSYVAISQGDTVRKISETGQILWQRTLSFQFSFEQYVSLNAIAETDKGYILLGGNYDWDGIPVSAVIVKLGEDGIVEWTKTFQYSREFYFNSAFSTADGGYIVHGGIWGNTSTSATTLVKLTSNGKVLWSKIFDDLSDLSVSLPVSDGVILASRRGPERILKVNDSGNIVWVKSLESNGFRVHSIGPSSDNGVILAGKSFGKGTIVLVRVSAGGNVDWDAVYELKDPFFRISSVARTSDEGYVISGTKFNGRYYENPSGFIIKIDSKQNLAFHKKFGRSDRKEYATQIFPSADGSYVLFGGSQSENGVHTLFLHVNSEGIVPGCSFFDRLSVKKVSSPIVWSPSVELKSRNFALTVGKIDANSAVSTSPSSTTCP